jgi:Arc/MetJ-type ribon-helix-helix transcriptional regulator
MRPPSVLPILEGFGGVCGFEQSGYPGAMNITLTQDQEAWLKAEIAEGHFATPEDVISYAINQAKRAALRDTLNASIARGGANSADDVRRAMAERVKMAP